LPVAEAGDVRTGPRSRAGILHMLRESGRDARADASRRGCSRRCGSRRFKERPGGDSRNVKGTLACRTAGPPRGRRGLPALAREG
ncbi:hypothetical protein QU38_01435, partial [Staphylococcus aureus]